MQSDPIYQAVWEKWELKDKKKHSHNIMYCDCYAVELDGTPGRTECIGQLP